MPSNTPIPAAELLALADARIERLEALTVYLASVWMQIDGFVRDSIDEKKIGRYPVIQGTGFQMALTALAKTPRDDSVNLIQVAKETTRQRKCPYRAARAASPVTLEEALSIELAQLELPHPSGVQMSPESVRLRTREIVDAIREHGLKMIEARALAEVQNARRLAGEGGA